MRDKGKNYLTEIIEIDNHNNYRLYLSAMISYSYMGNGNLLNEKTKTLVSRSENRFDYLSLYDYQMCKEQQIPTNEEGLPYYKDQLPKVTGKKFIDCYFPPEFRIINSFDH